MSLRRLAPLVLLLAACDPAPPEGTDAGTERDAASDDGGWAMDAGGFDASTDAGPPPMPVEACPADDCWDTDGPSIGCGATTLREDFRTQMYNVHALRMRIVADRPARLELRATSGAWSPALLVGRPGEPAVFDGERDVTNGDLTVTATRSGRGDEVAEVTVTSTTTQDLLVYVTSWATRDAGFDEGVAPPMDAGYELTVEAMCSGGLVAPADAIASEVLVAEGQVDVSVGGGDWGTPVRVDATAGEHVGFRLELPSDGPVEMALFMWDGAAPVRMRVTNFGDGPVRRLATRDPDGARTFWVRARGRAGDGTVTVTRTPLSEAARCTAGCVDMLQLPLPVDREAQGYDSDAAATFIYQFGRRDLMQAILYAGRRVVAAGYRPFTLKDLSRPDGSKPPDHATHDNGNHADVSLYDSSGDALWGAPCASGSSGCTADRFGAAPLTLLMASLFETDMVSTIYLDCAYHEAICDTATGGPDSGDIGATEREILCRPVGLACPTPSMSLTMPPAYPLRHVPSHHHHIHVRVDGY